MRTETLLAAALRGDPTAFAALVDAVRPRMTAVVERMLGDPDEAEDVVQEALLRGYVGISQLRDASRFGGWLCGIAVNVAKMRLRRRATERRMLAVITAGGGTDDLEERELLRLVEEALELLSPPQRDVVLMHYVDGLSCGEIGELLGRSPGAVRVRLHRARRQLRERLAPTLFEPVPPEETKEVVMVEVQLDDVVVRVSEDDPENPVGDERIVMLKEKGGERLLPIWIGSAEGNMLALRLTGERTPRPVTPDLMAELVRATGARVDRVSVTSLREKTFYATIALDAGGRVEELDARPSDAINLAVRVGAPIYVDSAVLDENSMTPDDLTTRVQREAEEAGIDVPPGTWRSLSAELLRPLFAPP